MVVPLIATATVFGSWTLLLQVVPFELNRTGSSAAVAGAATGVFMAATVLAQIITPRALRRWGYKPVFAAGGLLMGLPALLYLPDLGDGAVVAQFMVATALRGCGFGFATVASAASIAELAPAGALGKFAALQGVGVAAPQFVALPAGAALADAGRAPIAYLAAAGVALIGVAALLFMEPLQVSRDSHGGGGKGDGARGSRTRIGLAALQMAVSSAAFGAAATVTILALPERASIIGLATAAATAAMMCGRLAAGWLGGWWAEDVILIGSMMIAGGGLALYAWAVSIGGNAGALFAAALLFGLAFGAVQNASLVVTFHAAGPDNRGRASATWNIAYDAGTGVGATAFAAMVSVTGFVGSFVVAAAATVGTALLAAPLGLRRK